MMRLQANETMVEVAEIMAADELGGVADPGAHIFTLHQVKNRGVRGLALLVLLDLNGIYGQDILRAFDDVCHQDYDHLARLLGNNVCSLKNGIALARDGLL